MKEEEVVITDIRYSLHQRSSEGKHVTEREWARKGDEGKSCVKRQLRVEDGEQRRVRVVLV